MLEEVRHFGSRLVEDGASRPLVILLEPTVDSVAAAGILIRFWRSLDRPFSVHDLGSSSPLLSAPSSRVYCALGVTNFRLLPRLNGPLYVLGNTLPSETSSSLSFSSLLGKEISLATTMYASLRPLLKSPAEDACLALVGATACEKEQFSAFSEEAVTDCKGYSRISGPLLSSALRPLKRALEYSTSPFFPEISGNGIAVLQFLKEFGLDSEKSLLEMSLEERSRLSAGLISRRRKGISSAVVGTIHLGAFFGKLSDLSEVSDTFASCLSVRRLDLALALALGHAKTRLAVDEAHTSYQQTFLAHLRELPSLKVETGDGFELRFFKAGTSPALASRVLESWLSHPRYTHETLLFGTVPGFHGDTFFLKSSQDSFARGDSLLRKGIEQFSQRFPHNRPLPQGPGVYLFEQATLELFLPLFLEHLRMDVIKV